MDVAQAADLPVHQVLALAAAIEAPGDRGLGRSVRVGDLDAGDLQVHLGHLQRLPCLAAVEDDILHGRTTEALGALLAEHPGDGVGDVALAAAVGADDARHAPFERDLLPVAEALESDDLDRIEAHESFVSMMGWSNPGGLLPPPRGLRLFSVKPGHGETPRYCADPRI